MKVLPISVITVARNAEATIDDSLSSIQKNNPAEIIVVDGNSSDRTVEITRKYTGRIYSDDGRGLAHARQLGAEQATQEYISYIDADITLPPGTLATMLDEFQSSPYVSISARIKAGSRPAYYWERATHEHVQIIFSRGNTICLAASLLKRDTILKYGFDPLFPLLDDTELIYSLSKDRYKFGISSACAYHYHRANLKGFAKQRFVNGRGKAQFLWKYGLWHPTMWTPLLTIYMLGFCLIKGKPNLIPYFLLGGIIETAGIMKGFLELVRDRRNRRV